MKTPNPGGTKSGGLNEIFALGCGAADNCWGAGTYGSANPPGKNLNEILHWNGKTWTKTATPNPDGTKTGAGNQLEAATSSRQLTAGPSVTSAAPLSASG